MGQPPGGMGNGGRKERFREGEMQRGGERDGYEGWK